MTAPPKLSPGDAERLTALQAHAAPRFQIHTAVDVETGVVSFVCERWALSRELASLDDLEAWLKRAGVKVPT